MPGLGARLRAGREQEHVDALRRARRAAASAPQRSAPHPSSPPVTMTTQRSPATDARSPRRRPPRPWRGCAARGRARARHRGPPRARRRRRARGPRARRWRRTRPRPRPARAGRPAGRPAAGERNAASPRRERRRPVPGRRGERRQVGDDHHARAAPAASGSPGSPRRAARRPGSGGAAGASGGASAGCSDGMPLDLPASGRGRGAVSRSSSASRDGCRPKKIGREEDRDRRDGEARPDRASTLRIAAPRRRAHAGGSPHACGHPGAHAHRRRLAEQSPSRAGRP